VNWKRVMFSMQRTVVVALWADRPLDTNLVDPDESSPALPPRYNSSTNSKPLSNSSDSKTKDSNSNTLKAHSTTTGSGNNHNSAIASSSPKRGRAVPPPHSDSDKDEATQGNNSDEGLA